MTATLRPDGGTATADRLPHGQADEFDVSNTDGPAESFADQQARYDLEKAEYDRWQADHRAAGAEADAALRAGDVAWIILQVGPRFEAHPATAYERHPERGWSFNVQYPGRLAFFREVAYCGPFWENGRWCAVGTVPEPLPKEPVKPAAPLATRTVVHLSAVKPSGGTLEDAIRGGEKPVAEFDGPDAADKAAAHWPKTTEFKAGWIGVVTRKVLNDPAAPAYRVWDSLHGAYPKPIEVLPKG